MLNVSLVYLSKSHDDLYFYLPPMKLKKKTKKKTLISREVALHSATLENNIGIHATAPGNIFFLIRPLANIFPGAQQPQR